MLNWQLTPASHERDWRADYSRLPQVSEEGGVHRVENIREWGYAPDGAATRQEWIAREIDPGKLTHAYFLVEPFNANEAIAHTMLVFAFEGGAVTPTSFSMRRGS